MVDTLPTFTFLSDSPFPLPSLDDSRHKRLQGGRACHPCRMKKVKVMYVNKGWFGLLEGTNNFTDHA